MPDSGCTIIVPATIACVPSTKANVTPAPPGGGGTGTPNSFFCYKLKCPKAKVLPTITGADQFGSRTVAPRAAKLLCAPLAGATTTTSTTATSTTGTATSTTGTGTTTTTLRFVDNGDGTVTDHQTGLIWEKKDNTCPGPHCVNDTFTWSSSGSAPDGTAFTSFLNTLNGGVTGVGNCVSPNGNSVTGGFNGQCDWRLPSIVELQTISERTPGCGSGSPCIDPIFGPTPPTGTAFYWSSTTDAGNPSQAWFVFLFNGNVPADYKFNSFYVRAVRGGS